jgi:hypothetical protein
LQNRFLASFRGPSSVSTVLAAVASEPHMSRILRKLKFASALNGREINDSFAARKRGDVSSHINTADH